MAPGNLIQLAKTAWNFRKLGADGQKAIEILTGAANPILDRWFESEEVKTTISTDAIIGAFATPSMPGTAYVLFHHVMGECDGVRGVWGYVRGGMGALSNAIASAAKERGAEIKVNAPVSRILVQDGRASGVALADGTEYSADRVVSCLDANVTFLRLMDRKDLPADFVESVKHLDYSSASCKINLALSEVPNFTCLPGNTPGPQHHGTIHISPNRTYIEKAYDCAKYGYISENPVIEATIPSSLDDTVAPKGKHVMSMFTQYFPYKLAPDAGTLEENKKRYAERCIDIMTEYAPNFRKAVINYQVLAPGRPRINVWPHWRQHHARCHVTLQSRLHAAAAGLRRLSNPGQGTLSLRRRHPSRRRRDGRLRLQRRARNPQRRVIGGTERKGRQTAAVMGVGGAKGVLVFRPPRKGCFILFWKIKLVWIVPPAAWRARNLRRRVVKKNTGFWSWGWFYEFDNGNRERIEGRKLN